MCLFYIFNQTVRYDVTQITEPLLFYDAIDLIHRSRGDWLIIFLISICWSFCMYDCAYDFLMNFKIMLKFEPKTEENMGKYYIIEN